MKKRRVAIVGTNGIPANYGGFETLAENLTKHLSKDFDFIVYCSKTQPEYLKTYNGARLHNIKLKANGKQSVLYDFLSLCHACFNADIILYLGPVLGLLTPLLKLFGKTVIVNHGGLNEWERPKYNKIGRLVAKTGRYACRLIDYNVADNDKLKKSLSENFGFESVVIRYGGDHAQKVDIDANLLGKYPFMNKDYYISISRAQADNNLHVVLDAFKNSPDKTLVMVSNWSHSAYGVNLKQEYNNIYPNIILLDAVYDPKEINALRSNAVAYIHSHSFCGTAPSLVEAMSLGLAVFSFEVQTNIETTNNQAFFFSDSKQLCELLWSINDDQLQTCRMNMKSIAEQEYKWSIIASQYAELFKTN